MTTPLAAHYLDVTVRIRDLIAANTETIAPVPINNVFYGDQALIPGGLTVCVHPGPQTGTMQGSSQQRLNTFKVFILVYVSKIQDIQDNRLLADQTCKGIEHLLQNNLQLRDANGLNPILIHGFVEESDPGYTIRQGTMFEAVRMTWAGMTKTMLSQ